MGSQESDMTKQLLLTPFVIKDFVLVTKPPPPAQAETLLIITLLSSLRKKSWVPKRSK